MFNETYTFDVPRKHVQSISIILTFKQLIYNPGVPRMSEKTIGKCVLGAAAQTDTAQLHWKEMIMNARKPIIQWQALWWWLGDNCDPGIGVLKLDSIYIIMSMA